MNSLKVPDGGLLLEGASGQDAVVPPQAFALSLSDDVVEQLIRSAQKGEHVELQLGKSPALRYGSKSHEIPRTQDDAPYDLYLTKPFESTRKAERIAQSGSLFHKPRRLSAASSGSQAAKAGGTKHRNSASSKGSSSSGLDSDREALQNGLAAAEAGRERAQILEKPLNTKKTAAKAKGKLLSNYTPKSIPTSPAMNATRSPMSTPVLSATQQAMERTKGQRFELIHELAAKARPSAYLKGKWAGKPEEFMPTLEKCADYNSETKTWTIRKSCWRDLDVWKYDYETQEDRQAAIENAIRQYDKQRLSSSEVEWQRLLPKEERGKGKCLSRLQANLAKGPAQAAPKIKVQKADESSSSKDDGDSQEGDKAKAGGESMSRSNSYSKARKPTAQEAQAKRLLSNSKNRAPAATKVTPAKAKSGTTKNGGRVLSAAIIENSDSSGDEVPLMKPKPKPINKTQDTVVVDTRPIGTFAKDVKKRPQPQQPVKRSRDDSDSSSSSGTPLSKRIKPKQPLPAPGSRQDTSKTASQRARNGSAHAQTQSHKHTHRKSNSSTSPTKSSPLAMSPPTNASELDDDSSPPAVSLKRKAMEDDKPRLVKRRAVESVPGEVMSKANKFKSYYQKYEALHYQISALDNPPHQMVANLIDMRGRLETMKKEIYKQYSPERD